jgi:hypothetical protein
VEEDKDGDDVSMQPPMQPPDEGVANRVKGVGGGRGRQGGGQGGVGGTTLAIPSYGGRGGTCEVPNDVPHRCTDVPTHPCIDPPTHPPIHSLTHPPKVVSGDEQGWHGSVEWMKDNHSFPIAICGKSLEFWTMREPNWEITDRTLNFDCTISMVACTTASVDMTCTDFMHHVQCEIVSKDETKSAKYTRIHITGE